MPKTTDISLVIPLLDEAESLPELTERIQNTCKNENLVYEIIFIDDGSKDQSWSLISDLSEKYNEIKGIKFQRNYGKSAALYAGFEAAQGNVVMTMDADLQDRPEEISEFYKMIQKQGFDLVSGWKKKRSDPVSKTMPTKLYNWATRKMSGIYLHDFNCGLKAYKKSVVKSIEVYGEMHRYIPILAKSAGFNKIGEKVVEHDARKYGKSKFGVNRFINGFLDLGTIVFTVRFSKKPMHFFGLLGTLMFIVGFGFAIYLGIDKLLIHQSGRLLANRAEFFISLTAMIIGVQFFMTGFLAEMIGRNSNARNQYLIEQKTNIEST